MADVTDEQLFGYALIHSETALGLFHIGHVERLLRLAGRPVNAVACGYSPNAFISLAVWEVEEFHAAWRERERWSQHEEERV